MTEYIERKTLINSIKERNDKILDWVMECILKCPTIDLRPERHGQWIEKVDVQICSECGEEYSRQSYKASYCENCGAKMNKENMAKYITDEQNNSEIIICTDALTNLLTNKKHRNIFHKKPAACIDPVCKNCSNCEWGKISYRRRLYPNEDYFAVHIHCALGYDTEIKDKNK